jgi:CheY-like chemotaxis protein
MSLKKHTIIYAEDDEDDVQLVNECFASFSNVIEVRHAYNGQEALELLETLLKQQITPCLIILDINMPVMDGKQALVKIKSNPDFKKIPTILFTTSNSRLDIAFAQNWGADFITKPLNYEEITSLAKEFSKRCTDDMITKEI